MDGSWRGRGFCRYPQPAGLEPVERKAAGRDSHPRRRNRTAPKRNPEEWSERTLDSHLLHLTERGVKRQCGARIDPTRLSQCLPALRGIRRVATGWFPGGTEMKKRSAIFAAALIVLVLFGSGCNPTERDTVATPSPTVMPAMTPPEAHPSPSASAAPEWLAAGATNRVAEITGAPNAFLGKTVTVVAEVDEVYGPRAFTLNGE